MQKLHKQLIDACESLTPENWNKGRCFTMHRNSIRMCPHGAFQLQVNPKIRKLVTNPDPEYLNSHYGHLSWMSRIQSSLRTFQDAIAFAPNQISKNDWDNLPDWITINTGRGSLEGHFLLGVVGLTLQFNDHPDTTFEMVRKKFYQAAYIANMIARKNYVPQNHLEQKQNSFAA